jgi:fibronectin-binding autotransporter adhesin
MIAMKFPIRHFVAFAAMLMACGISGGRAQTYQTWRGEATSGSWQGSQNWWNFPNGSPIVFGQQEWNNNHYTSQTNDNGGSTFNTWRWVFQSGASSAHTFTGDAVRFFDSGGADPAIINQSSATHNINMAISGDGDSADPLKIQIDNNGGGGLSFGSTVNNQGSDLHVIGSATAAATVTFNGVISGSAGFYKENSNLTVEMKAVNTYSGQTTIQAGTVRLSSSGSLASSNVRLHSGGSLDVTVNATVNSVAEYASGNAGTVSISSGAVLTIDGADQGTLYQNSITGAGGLTMAGSGNTVISLYGTQSFSGGITVTGGKLSTSVALSSGSFTLNGGTFETQGANQISDTASVTLGGGTLSLGGTETIGNNGVTLSSGTTSSISPANNVVASINGVVSGSGNLTKANSGTLILAGNNTHSGTTTVSAGVLRIGHANALGSTTGATTVSTGAALELSNSVAVGAEVLTLSGDGISYGGSLRNVSGNNSWAGNITNSSNARINSDAGTLTLSGAISNAASQSLYFGGVGNVTVDGAITGNLATGNGAVYKDGTGNLTLSANNSGLTGLLRIKGGTVTVTNGNSLGSGSVEFGSGATLVTLQVNSNATIANRFELDNNTTNAVINVASGQTATFTGVLSQTNGTVNTNKFGKDGAGTLVFNNSGGTYNGQIQIGQGDVVLGANNALGTNTSTSQRGVDLGLNVGDVAQANNVSLLASNGVTVGQSIWVEQNTSGATRTIGISGSGTATFTNEVRMNTGTTLTVQAGSSGTDRVNISGPITQNSGAASGVIKQGAGTLALSGANTYTGTTTINAGTLKLERLSGGIGAASVTGSTIAVNSGGTLLLGAANQIGDTTGITMSGGTLGMGGFSDTAGKLSVSANSIFDFGNTGAGTSTFTFSDFDTATYGGVAGLTMQNVNIGSQIVFNTNYNGNSTFNTFSSKISFSNTQLMNQISFSGGTTTLTVAAIPEPRVYAAAAGLVLLIGWAEYKRRKGKKLGVRR